MIDWDRVGELREEIGAEDFAEVLELFLTEVEDAMDRLEAARGNAIIAEEQMHFLKGASLNLGFEALASLCQTGEKAAASGDTDTVPPEAVREAYIRSKADFENDYPVRFAA